MRLYIIRGPALSGKTERLLLEMQRAHRHDPLSYTFLGPSGIFVKEFSDWFAHRLESSVARGNFMVIDQFAVELYWAEHPGQIHVDEGLTALFIAEIVHSLDEKTLGNLYPIRDSPRLVRFVAEAVKDARDNGEPELIGRLANDESKNLIRTVLDQLKLRYGDGAFDTFDAYLRLDRNDVEDRIGSRFGRTLFIDGFMNLSKAHTTFLVEIVSAFDEVFISLDTSVSDKNAWNEFEETLRSRSVEIIEETLPPRDGSEALEAFVKDEDGRKINSVKRLMYKDPEEELTQVCREIKRRIVGEGLEPGNIAIVLNNFSQRAREFSNKLAEYGVPARTFGDEPVSGSIAVQLLTLPFKTALSSYPPERIISMLDHGMGLLAPADFEIEELECLAACAGLYISSRDTSLEDRSDEWREKLNDHVSALETKLKILSRDESVFESDLAELKDDIRLSREIRRCADEIFESLAGIEDARTTGADLGWYAEEFETWMAPLKNKISDCPMLEDEAMALDKVEAVLHRLRVAMKMTGKAGLKLDEFMALLDILLDSEEYRPSLATANRVEILSLSSARFRHRSLKFVVNFNDGVFPVRRINPLYSPDGPNKNYGDEKEREQREDLYSCLCTCTETIITYPEASREGEPQVPSLWLDRLGEGQKAVLNKQPMSIKELKAEHGFCLARGKTPKVSQEVQDMVEPLNRWKDGTSFSWKIEDKAVLKALVGNGFSYSKLADFKNCPFVFFLRRIMGLDRPEDDGYNLSPLERGSAYHSALQILYDWGQEVGGEEEERRILRLADEESKVREVTEAVLEQFVVANKVRSLPAVKNSMIDDVSSALQRYLEFEMKKSGKACIGEKTLTELSFRLSLRDMARMAPRSAERYGDLVLRGRIDRVDLNVAEKKRAFDIVVSDYKSGSAGDWDQLKLYSMVLLNMRDSGLPEDPRLMKGFFRLIKGAKTAKNLEFYPAEARMELYSRPKSTLSFADLDDELLQTFDEIFEKREFMPGSITGRKANCYFCDFNLECEGLIERAGRC